MEQLVLQWLRELHRANRSRIFEYSSNINTDLRHVTYHAA